MRWVIAAGLLLCRPAVADPELSPIVDRNYAIDLYDGVALGNSATIAMGGAAVANAAGSSGTLINASAPAVRPTTDTDYNAFDYHVDYLIGALSHDATNAQVPTPGDLKGGYMLTLGGALRYYDWGWALNFSTQHTPIGTGALAAETTRARAAMAKWVPQIDTSIGIAVHTALFRVQSGDTTLFELQGAGVELAAQWIPYWQDVRLGASIVSKILGKDATAESCDPNDCLGFIVPDHVRSPWRLAVGGAYRIANTPWNQLVRATFRDERALTVVADLVVTGSSPNAYGLEAFGQHLLERSGRHASVSPRGGAEYEWLPGRLRVRGGSYWEPERFVGVPGRLHVTFGIEVMLFEFHAWGRRRARITTTGDVASQYKNLGLSIGFWH